MKLNPTKKADPLSVKLFRQAVDSLADGVVQDNNVMSKMRGNSKSRLLMITSPCTEAEYQQGIPFCDAPAKAFHDMLMDYQINSQKHFLVTTCSAYGDKPSKHSTEVIGGFIKKAIEFKLFDMYVCVGDTAFKYLFGQGKKPASGSLHGSTVFIPETGYKPLFTFPDPAMMVVPNIPMEDWLLRRAQNMAAANETKYHKYCRAFVATLKQHKIKL